jgi:hypothetical protein
MNTASYLNELKLSELVELQATINIVIKAKQTNVKTKAETKIEPVTLSNLLLGKSSGNFVNSKEEYCRVNYYYLKNQKYYQVIFCIDGMATRPAIKSTSEKKVIKILQTEGFKLI